MSLSASEVHALKVSSAAADLEPAIRQRWSARAFADRAVAEPELRRVFEAARWAASAYNEQPWRFLVGLKGDKTHKAIYESLIGFNQEWAGRAPVLILGLAHTKYSHNGTANLYALYDLGSAVGQLTVEAAALGLTTHQMAGFDQERARKSFKIPADCVLGTVIALGYQGEPEVLAKNERLLGMETAPRERKSLDQTVFAAWGEPARLG